MSSVGREEEVGELADALRAEIEEKMEKDTVYLNSRKVDDAAAVFVAEKLQGNTTVRRLWLIKCRIGPAGASALAASLGEHNSKLTRLDLDYSKDIGDDGAEALAQMLKENATLANLSLSGCGIGARGARALGKALKENSTLKYFQINSNDVSDDGAEALAEALRWNESLTRLDLRNCQLTAAGASALVAALRESNSTLTRLELGDNDEIEHYLFVRGSIKTLLKENWAVVPASAEQRARCLLFCCLRLAPTAHEHAVPSIGAVPVPVMRYAVEHAGSLHVAERFEVTSALVGQSSAGVRARSSSRDDGSALRSDAPRRR